MRSDIQLSTLDAVFDPAARDDCEDVVDDGTSCSSARCEEPVIEGAATTRQLWYDYLARFDVASAMLTVTLPGAAGWHHSFLLGFEDARDNPQATRVLLALNARLWRRVGDMATHHFQVAPADLELSAAELSCCPAGMPQADDRGIAIQLRHNGATIRALFFRRSGAGRFSEAECGALLLVGPLLADSATAMAQLARQSQHSAMLEAMFDRVSLSMALLSADARPLFVNKAAATMIDQRKWLIRAADGTVTAANPQRARALRDSIRRAATAETPVEDVFRLDCASGDWRLAYVFSAKSRLDAGTVRCAMMIVMGPGRVDAPRALLEALGLLPSEQRFLGHFLRSSSLGNAAEGCGLSEETARTYLKRVRAKLGVHRQMELAGLISGLVLPFNTSESPAMWGG